MNKKGVIKYLQNNEFNIQKAFATYTIVEVAFENYAKTDIINGIEFGPVFAYFDFSDRYPFYQIIRQDAISGISDKLYADFLKNQKSLDRVFNQSRKLTKKIDQAWKIYDKNNSQEEIFSIFLKILEIASTWWQFAAILEDKGDVINRKIVSKFQGKYKLSSTDAGDLVMKLSHPSEMAIYTEERRQFLNICQYFLNKSKQKERLLKNKYEEIVQDGKISELLKQYEKDFFWFKSDFYKAVKITDFGILADVLREIKTKTSVQIKNEIKEIDKNFKELLKEKQKLRKKIKLSKEELKDIYFAERIIYWTDQRKIEMMKQLYYIYVLFEEIAKSFNIKYRDLAVYTLDEVCLLIRKGIKVNKINLKKRHNSMFIVCEKNKKTQIIYGNEARKLLAVVQSATHKELKGMVASGGGAQKIRGKVCVVSNPEKINFNEGEVLVTSMTRVEFVPMMRKAKAIITDEGGIACHAAIVSREMNKPAIIGTKNATRILKDGDIVEMNMQTGEIRIIKK